jgi:polyhydroxybutyrate depolymerase
MSGPDEVDVVEHHRTRSLFVVLGVLGLLAAMVGSYPEVTSHRPRLAAGRTSPPVDLETATVPTQLTPATTSASTNPTSPRPATPARASSGCANPRGSQAPGTAEVPIVSGGEHRSYLRSIPTGTESSPSPLVVVLDDGSGDPGPFLDRAQWGAIAQQRHLIVAAPRWTRSDDGHFIADAIADTELGTCVDLARVYLAGFASGAMLGSRVVCEHPGLVTAFVAVAGLLSPDRCPLDDRIPVLVVQGALDEAVSPSSVVDAARAWARQDRCRPEPFSEVDGWNTVYYKFDGCDSFVDVELYVLTDMGHEWPEPVDNLNDAKRWADLMDTTSIASAFFETYAR